MPTAAIHLARPERGDTEGLRLCLGRPAPTPTSTSLVDRKVRAAPGCTLGRCSRRPPDPNLLVTGVLHQVGRGHRRRCVKCFRRFILMFQVFHLDVAKVDLGCCNDNIHILQAYVSNVSFGCCRNILVCRITCMFQVHVLSV